MGSNGGDEDVMMSGCCEAKCSETTVEIKIKTLDSQIYTLRVDKRVPVPALKDQIATVTGVLSEQQRLICRGKVLTDDQLLSAYHVEDGHTLHLVVRQPISPSTESSFDHSATDPALSTADSQGNQLRSSVFVGTMNLSERDGGFPDLTQIISAVLNSFGMTSTGSSGEGIDLREPGPERLIRTPGLEEFTNSRVEHFNEGSARGQTNSHDSAYPLFNAISSESPQPSVIPDSLATLSQYLSRLRHEFGTTVRGQDSEAAETHGSSGQETGAASIAAAGPGGLPTPASLAEVMLSTRQMLTEQAGVCLSQLSRELEDHPNVTDPLARMSTQSNAVNLGVHLQRLGALLLELGRTTMTLRMGQTPAEALVNAGPAVFVSTSGPNPIMVQPLPFQPGTSFGAISGGTVQPTSGFSGLSLGSGSIARNVDIRIHTASLIPSASQREPTVAPESPAQSIPSASEDGFFVHQTAADAAGSPPSAREPEIRVVPIRTVVAAVTAPIRRPPSDSSRGSTGLYHPVLSRTQHTTTGNGNGSRDSLIPDEHHSVGLDVQQQSIVQQQNIGFSGADGSGTQSGLDQLLRTIFPGEDIHVGDANLQEMSRDSSRNLGERTLDATDISEDRLRADDDGTFLSNLLHQIMPVISQSTASVSDPSFSERDGDTEDRTTQISLIQAQENSDRGVSRRRGEVDPPSSPTSKRQKKE